MCFRTLHDELENPEHTKISLEIIQESTPQHNFLSQTLAINAFQVEYMNYGAPIQFCLLQFACRLRPLPYCDVIDAEQIAALIGQLSIGLLV